MIQFEGCRNRSWQRSGNIDLTAALMQASDHFLAADASTITNHVVHREVFYLRCGPGLLICTPIHCRTPNDVFFTYCRARTWISNTMAWPDQVPLPAATDPAASQLLYLVGVAFNSREPTRSEAND